jgi:hypothetical protein
MEPTVLAGPVEFSPAEIALILAVMAGIFVAVMAPGWALVAFAAQRRRKTQRPGPAPSAALRDKDRSFSRRRHGVTPV